VSSISTTRRLSGLRGSLSLLTLLYSQVWVYGVCTRTLHACPASPQHCIFSLYLLSLHPFFQNTCSNAHRFYASSRDLGFSAREEISLTHKPWVEYLGLIEGQLWSFALLDPGECGVYFNKERKGVCMLKRSLVSFMLSSVLV